VYGRGSLANTLSVS